MGVREKVRTVISIRESIILGRFRLGSEGNFNFNFYFHLKYSWEKDGPTLPTFLDRMLWLALRATTTDSEDRVELLPSDWSLPLRGASSNRGIAD